MIRRRLLSIALILLLLTLGSSVLVAGARSPAAAAPAASQIAFDSTRMASDNFALDWNVAASGGGRASSDSFRLSSTIGQPVIGEFTGSHFNLRAGFWQEWVHRVLLPVLQRT